MVTIAIKDLVRKGEVVADACPECGEEFYVAARYGDKARNAPTPEHEGVRTGERCAGTGKPRVRQTE